MKNNFAFFDFCDTLIKYQTADNFVYFIIKNDKKFLRIFLYKLLKSNFFNLFFKYFNLKNFRKKIILFLLIGLKKNKIENFAINYYNEILKPKINNEVLEKLIKLKNTHNIYIISAGYSIYIDVFCKSFNIKKSISNEIKFFSNFSLGIIKRKDCYGKEKVNRIKSLLSEFKFKNSVAFSDCHSDTPLFEFCEKGYLIKNINNLTQIELYEKD